MVFFFFWKADALRHKYVRSETFSCQAWTREEDASAAKQCTDVKSCWAMRRERSDAAAKATKP